MGHYQYQVSANHRATDTCCWRMNVLTHVVASVGQEEAKASEELLPLVYEELCRLVRRTE